MAEAPRVWKVFCRMGDGRGEYADAAAGADFVALGGGKVGPVAQYATRDDLRAAWHEEYDGRHVRADHVWRLEHDVKDGEWVCMPSSETRLTYVGYFEGARTYFVERPDPSVCPFEHRRRVRWLYTVPTDELERRLGAEVVGRQALNELPSLTAADLVRAAREIDVRSAPRPRRYWAVGADPDRYRVEDAVRRRETDLWTTGGKSLLPGDRLLIWKFAGGSGRRGVVALADVIDVPRPRGDVGNPYWVRRDDDGAALKPRVNVRYFVPARAPLWLGGEHAEPLAGLAIERARGGTVFEVSLEQWTAVVAALGGWPEASAEVEQAIAAAEAAAGRAPSRGQGFGLTAEQRRAVELRAMEVAAEHYVGLGYDVEDVSGRESFDLKCGRDGETLHVEVKGTTGLGETFVITRNEHALARRLHPANALVVVSRIELSAQTDGTTLATGGVRRVVEPWDLGACAPEPIAYECRVPTV